MVKKLKSPRRLAALAIFAVIAMSAFGFAAANTGPGATNAGSSSDAISGFTITNVHYQNSGPDLTNVSFDLAPAATSVNAKVTASGSYATCSLSAITGGSHASCGISGVTVLAADQLSIVAVQ